MIFLEMSVVSNPEILCRRLWPICSSNSEVDHSILSSKRKKLLTTAEEQALISHPYILKFAMY